MGKGRTFRVYFNLLRESSGSRPAQIKGTIQNRRTDGDDVFSALAGPIHTRAIETMFKLFDLTFNTARANGKARLLEISIVHPGLVVLKIGGGIRHASVVKFSDYRIEMTVKQGIGLGVKPTIGTRGTVWEKRLGCQGEVLTGMVVIDNLHAVGEMGIDQVPNPSRAIGGDTRTRGLLEPSALCQIEQYGRKRGHIPQDRTVMSGCRMNVGHRIG